MAESCDPLIRDGVSYIQWIFDTFGSCIYGNQELISIAFGYLSVFCWLNAQFPQLIENFRNKSVSGLSVPFLFNWLLGDISNLLGCILTNQLPFQVYLAIYFCIVDLCLFYQYFYYTRGRASIRELTRNSSDEERKKLEINSSHKDITTVTTFAIMFLMFHFTRRTASTITTSSLHALRSPNVDDIPSKTFFQENSLLIGRIFAWTCAILYLSSRIPQIIKNHKRKSVEGLSIFMFIFAALGNLNYSLSIFINPRFSRDDSYVRETIPYVLGAIGTLGFDLTIFVQWYRWRRNNKGVDKATYAMLMSDEVCEEALMMDEIYKRNSIESEDSSNYDD
ncbi:16298_t:CDS:2 [Acaulospora morrowiae]|uniref:16298_t:CDS:1 n=1 Tax=Acaulospora morrowiae TaxID=94023 RepID=A0A9N9H0I9_9GLOM|nr:16298_t:CDS:2 [Acaulospora morrowiae]